MTSRTREPSRLPVRGTLAAVLTVGGMALLLSFRSPGAPASAVTATVDRSPDATEELLSPSPAVASDGGVDSTALAEPVRLVGDPYATRWGDVQVAITVDGSDIVDVETLAIPDGDRRSLRLSERAEPVLRTQAIVTDSAAVDVVSGATFTSEAYAQSLQSALDQVGV